MTLSEFADFRCGHCKHAMPTVKAFVKANPDVRFQFYSFPLDGQCNDAIPHTSGQSCYLAKSVLCAEKLAQKGSAIHDAIFNAQPEINGKDSMDYTKEKVAGFLADNRIDAAAMEQCIASPETDAAIRAQAKAGVDAKIRGTPAFFVNGKPLERAQLIPVLNAAKASLQ
jgi:protein-disulfide isomerase